MPLAVESRIGPYQIVSLIGSGSMGEVYRARDTRLNRDVAIKMVNTREAGEEAIQRFEHEAHTVGTLNHPNILTVHDVGREDGFAFLVTELIEGESLRKVLERGALSFRDVLDIGIQLASGLAAAHEVGIIHRDLKPENVMITREGRVKILDFGIAKVVEKTADATQTVGGQTAPGLLIGTLAYMSPEQARGLRVSYFTDQFSLGLVLYEMATGEAVFHRHTGLASLSAILTEEVPPLDVGSPMFQWLVKRLLHKEPDHRYASMPDVLHELRTIRATMTDAPGASQAALEPVTGRKLVRPKSVALGFGLVGVAVLIAALTFGSRGESVKIAREYVPVATTSGLDVFPALSPDGRVVAWASEVNGLFQIFTRSVDRSGPATQITSGPDDALMPFWSPDGGKIYFISGRALLVVSAAGGHPAVLESDVVRAAVAPDGKTLALLRPDGSLVSEGRKLMRSAGGSRFAFARDGKSLGVWMDSGFRMVPLDGGEPRKMSFDEGRAREFGWLGGRSIVFSDGGHLRVRDVNQSASELLSTGSGVEAEPSPSSDGRTVAFSSALLDYDVVRLRLDGRIEPVIAGTRSEHSPSLAPNGDVVYINDRNELILRVSSGWERVLVAAENGGRLSDASLSPDGRRVAFTQDHILQLVPTSGGRVVKVASHAEHPSWAPDSDSLVWGENADGRTRLLRSHIGNVDSPQQIGNAAATQPSWSPRGDLIAAIDTNGDLLVLDAARGSSTAAIRGPFLLHGWASDGHALFAVRRTASRHLELVSLRTDGMMESSTDIGAVPPAMTYAAATGEAAFRGFSITADGILTSMPKSSGDIWVLRR